MATRLEQLGNGGSAARVSGSLGDRTLALIGPRGDAILFWGAPLVAFLLVQAWLRGWDRFGSPAMSQSAVAALFVGVGILTWAHLIAVAPRAYLNREVFAAYRLRLTLVPVLLVALLLVSPTALVVAGVVAIFWDVHHSAMQNFGFSRLYDMKAGNPPAMLRAADLRLNWILYVGPLLAGAALGVHLDRFRELEGTGLAALTQLPGLFEAHHAGVRDLAILAYLGVLGWVAADYARAMRRGYRLPVHKAATLVVTGSVSVLAWGYSPPIVALVIINLYHAVQYFALVWLKEGSRMGGGRDGATAKFVTMAWFLGGCALFGLAYAAAVDRDPRWLLAPFIACSLLHFWYDGFVWSVRKRQV